LDWLIVPGYLRLTGLAYWPGLLWLADLVICSLLVWLIVTHWVLIDLVPTRLIPEFLGLQSSS
jgi:hypothetical protein